MTLENGGHRYSVWADDECVAKVWCADQRTALMEAMHYVSIYTAEGADVEIRGVGPDDWAILEAPSGWNRGVVQ